MAFGARPKKTGISLTSNGVRSTPSVPSSGGSPARGITGSPRPPRANSGGLQSPGRSSPSRIGVSVPPPPASPSLSTGSGAPTPPRASPKPPPPKPPGMVHTIQQLSTLEACMWSIVEGMKSDVTYVAFFCREYWGTSASKGLMSVEKFEWSEKLQKQLHMACILESLSLAVVSHLCSGTMRDVPVQMRSKLQSLLSLIHENCLVVFDLMRQRLHAKLQNGTAEIENGMDPGNLNFDMFIRVDRYRHVRKGEHSVLLRQQNDTLANTLRQICRQATSKVAIARGSSGMLCPGSPGVGRNSGHIPQGGILSVVSGILVSSTPLERVTAMKIRTSMMQHMRFHPLLNEDGDPDSPWPEVDPYQRFGADRFLENAPIIWYEPLPPMMADLERSPTLPPPPSEDSYCLILDLDETLVHYFEQDGAGTYGVRPYMFEFLERMESLGYELVIFTAATQDYADWVVGQIDPDGLIKHRLYRQHALPWGPLFAKDLSRLGRDLERTLIIDNVQENFMLHPNNGIFISTWYDDPDDTALSELTPMLEELITTQVSVPEILDKYRDQIPIWAGFIGDSSEGCFEGDPSGDGWDDVHGFDPHEGDHGCHGAPYDHMDAQGHASTLAGTTDMTQIQSHPHDHQHAPQPQAAGGRFVSQGFRPGPVQAPPPQRAAHPTTNSMSSAAAPQQQGNANGQWAQAQPQMQPLQQPSVQRPLQQHQAPQHHPQQQGQQQQQQQQQHQPQRQFYAASGIAGPYQAQQSYAVPHQQPTSAVGRYQRVDAHAPHDFAPYARQR